MMRSLLALWLVACAVEPTPLAVEYCALSASCGYNDAHRCIDTTLDAHARATSYGCESESLASLGCLADIKTCDGLEDRWLADPFACAPEERELERCLLEASTL